ncbi:MAG TPA: lycopene cyclase domain-containing protein [Ktedonobacteraceae bacterium]
MKHWLYLAFLLVWLLILVCQWLIGWRKLWHERFTWPWIVLGLGSYLSIADAVAIQQNIWFFRPAFITGWYLGNLPVEELCFYFLTTAMIVQGFVMLVPPKRPML